MTTTATRDDLRAVQERITDLSAQRREALDELAEAIRQSPWGAAYARVRALDQVLADAYAEAEGVAASLGTSPGPPPVLARDEFLLSMVESVLITEAIRQATEGT